MNRALAVTSSLAGAAICLALAAGGGCGSNNPTAPSGTGGVTVLGTGGMGATGGAGASDCPAIENVGDTIMEEQASGDLPTPMGGTVADGTYVLTRSQEYPPVIARSTAYYQETIRIAGTVMDIAVTSETFPSGISARANFGASGTEMSLVYVCGPSAGSSLTVGYTATASELILILEAGSVTTLTKR